MLSKYIIFIFRVLFIEFWSKPTVFFSSKYLLNQLPTPLSQNVINTVILSPRTTFTVSLCAYSCAHGHLHKTDLAFLILSPERMTVLKSFHQIFTQVSALLRYAYFSGHEAVYCVAESAAGDEDAKPLPFPKGLLGRFH